MKRRDLIKLATAGTAGLLLPITVSAIPKDLNAKELQKEIDQQIKAWIPMVEKAGLAFPVRPEFAEGVNPDCVHLIGSYSYIMSRTIKLAG